MRYSHKFRISANLQAVADFHSRSSSMPAITPPPVIVKIHRAPEILGEGDEMEFTLWLGPLPIRWLARIEKASITGFTDRQLHGPFEKWSHRHTFNKIDADHTEIHDEITFSVQKHPVWILVGTALCMSLPLLFSYRTWKTRRLLSPYRQRKAA